MSPGRGRPAGDAPGRSGGPRLAARAERLAKVYGSGDTQVTALRGIDLDFPRGRFTAIMGPSGSGKSTLMHCLAGLDTVSGGRVFIGDVELSRLSDRQLTQLRRDRIGFIFQQFNLLPTLTAAENITLPLDIAGRRPDKKWMQLVVDAVGLAPRLNHRPTELSGGQQQRVACARALITRPDIIFGDEPTGNLDSTSGAEVLSFLQDSVRELGQTVVMVTHDPKAASYADEVIFLADGRIVDTMLEPTADAVLDRMKNLDQPNRGRQARQPTAPPRGADRRDTERRNTERRDADRHTGARESARAGGSRDGRVTAQPAGAAAQPDQARRRPTVPPPSEQRRAATGAGRVPTGPAAASARRPTGPAAGSNGAAAGTGAGTGAAAAYRHGTGPARDGRGPARRDFGGAQDGPPPTRDGLPVLREDPAPARGAARVPAEQTDEYPMPRRPTGGYPQRRQPTGGYPPAEPADGYSTGVDPAGYPVAGPGPATGEYQPPWRTPYAADSEAAASVGEPPARRPYVEETFSPTGSRYQQDRMSPAVGGYGAPAGTYPQADRYGTGGYGDPPNGRHGTGGYDTGRHDTGRYDTGRTGRHDTSGYDAGGYDAGGYDRYGGQPDTQEPPGGRLPDDTGSYGTGAHGTEAYDTATGYGATVDSYQRPAPRPGYRPDDLEDPDGQNGYDVDRYGYGPGYETGRWS